VPLRALIYWSLRSDDLCDGGKDGPAGCPRSDEVECARCHRPWRADDTSAPGACPYCGASAFSVLRCPECRLHDLDDLRDGSSSGRLFERLLELEFDAAHFSIPWSDVTAEEVRGLQILKEERDRWQREQMEKQRNGVHG